MPQIGHLACVTLDVIAGQGHVSGLRPDPGHRLAGLADLVTGQGDALGLALDVDADAVGGSAVKAGLVFAPLADVVSQA